MYESRVVSLHKNCLAATIPSTKGSTASRCEGLSKSNSRIWDDLKAMEDKTHCVTALGLVIMNRAQMIFYITRGYTQSNGAALFGNQLLSDALNLLWNSAKIVSMGLFMTLANTLILPLWAIPMTTPAKESVNWTFVITLPFVPRVADASINAHNPGITASAPSIPNLAGEPMVRNCNYLLSGNLFPKKSSKDCARTNLSKHSRCSSLASV